jgi:hypothetical protein
MAWDFNISKIIINAESLSGQIETLFPIEGLWQSSFLPIG